ncbi:hypothetical protein SAMN05216452_2027 [Nitratireductor aquibiodomus]|uniref:Uncharacterized protein n=1 Tax=Nitratireductor aquibiodomus TaxID=204799 RepID=A0A1H4K7I3_9HYPH|nr:hypothetical protein SAMN05216452_2027 [Nitratireductor aquibiodomus]
MSDIVAERMGEISNLTPQAATAARAFARPIGAVSEANWREIKKMAEREGHSLPHKINLAALDFAIF